MEPLYYLIRILNFENHPNFYIKGDLVMSWTRMTSQNDQSIGLQRNPYVKWTIFRVCPVRLTLETCIGNDLDWKHTNLLETTKFYWKHTNQAGIKNRALKTVGNKSMVSKQSFEIENIICRFMFPIANFCFEITQYVSNLILLFRNSFTIDIACCQPTKCFQSMFPK